MYKLVLNCNADKANENLFYKLFRMNVYISTTRYSSENDMFSFNMILQRRPDKIVDFKLFRHNLMESDKPSLESNPFFNSN
ncbi:hypothetical protein BpHYR1_032352 [Brachionus plicatilis]|uniref:Uncharacterized protein n=1 Tax=Brachionus plicatilis TaxID=10195 RepID=A0A3M7QQW6_BRAPC|nr:hypothetical protein BpHYR1_032352 [Brachionus plicatilis]